MDSKFHGFAHGVEEKIEIYESRIGIMESMLKQKDSKKLQEKAASEQMKRFAEEVNALDSKNYSLRLELQKHQFDKTRLEKEISFLKDSLSQAHQELEQKITQSMVVKPVGISEEKLKSLTTELVNSQSIRSELESKLQTLIKENRELREKIEENRGDYQKEVTDLKIQLRNSTIKSAKSRFCSTTNMAPQKEKEEKDMIPVSIPEEPPQLVRKDSFTTQGWDKIKDVIHSKGERNSSNPRSKAGGSVKKSSPSESSSSNIEHEILSDSDSGGKKKAGGVLPPKTGAKDLKIPLPLAPTSTQTLPATTAELKKPAQANASAFQQCNPSMSSIKPMKPSVMKKQAQKAEELQTPTFTVIDPSKPPGSIPPHKEQKDKIMMLNTKLQEKHEALLMEKQKNGNKDQIIRNLKDENTKLKEQIKEGIGKRDSFVAHLVVIEKELVLAKGEVLELKSKLASSGVKSTPETPKESSSQLVKREVQSQADVEKIAKLESKVAELTSRLEAEEDLNSRSLNWLEENKRLQSKLKKESEDRADFQRRLESMKLELQNKDEQLIRVQCNLRDLEDQNKQLLATVSKDVHKYGSGHYSLGFGDDATQAQSNASSKP